MDTWVFRAPQLGTEIHLQHATKNVRFAGYREKVQALQQRNAALQAELEALQKHYKGGLSSLQQKRDLIEKKAADV